MKRAAAVLLLFVLAATASAADALRVVSAGPVGEVAALKETNEIRVVFSEPMVVLGKIPNPVTAPFVTISPAVPGTFRWSGTTTLIFTPAKPLPYATKYSVSVDQTAKAVSGQTLDKPYKFTFTTPTIQLQRAEWYRKNDKLENSVVIALWFNQPVDSAAILPHLSIRTLKHDIAVPPIPESGVEQLSKRDPQALPAFEAKSARAMQAAASNGTAVLASLATTWDKERFAPAKEMVVLETKPNVAADTSLQILLDEQLAASATRVRSGRTQQFALELEPTLFVQSITCTDNCDPDARNAVAFRTGPAAISYAAVEKALSLTDITTAGKETVVKPEKREREYDYPTSEFGLDELGYSLQPSRRYLIRIDPSLQANDGQKLGYTWMATVETSHRSAFISFGDGQGVWESSGGSVLPFHVRNFSSFRQWLAPLTAEQLMPTLISLQEKGFAVAPPNVKPTNRPVKLTEDRIQSIGLDVAPAIGAANRGFVWAAVEPVSPLPGAPVHDPRIRATIVQVTNLGVSVKDSPQNTLIFVTTLDDAKPVAGSTVSIRNRQNQVVWSGTTDAQGLAIAPNTRELRRVKPADGNAEEDESWRALGELHFIVLAEKEGDVAYVGSDWNEGITPWEVGASNFDLIEANPLLRGTVFTDRGVYKLGEEAHLKAIVRSDTPAGMQLLPANTNVQLIIRDSQDREVGKKTLALNEWSSTDWVFTVPADGSLGTYTILASVPGQKLQVFGDFLVAAYRRPDFRVDPTLTGASTLAGTKLNGVVVGRYLFGAPMSGRNVNWTYSKRPLFEVPAAVADRWPAERFTFLGYNEELDHGTTTIAQQAAKLDAKGELRLTLDTDKAAGWPYEYRIEGNVTDVSRQTIAGRTSYRVDPAPWYIGVKTPPYFAEMKSGFDTEIIAAGIDGLAVPGVKVNVKLQRIQWNSVRQSEGGGMYGWQTEKKEIDAGSWTITTQAQPVPLRANLDAGGEYQLTATATDPQGRTTRTITSFYVLGPGYTAWERHDHNRIDLVPEKRTYRPGETARIMIKSPWETATALLTTEREGVRTWKRFDLTSTQQTITVPIAEKDIPNVYVSVLLVKGRTRKDPGTDGSDPGKPAFRLGYVELTVEDASKRLAVDVKANREEFRPATKAKIDVAVKDAAGKGTQSEVTLWAVDYGVLSLTGYQTPDVLKSIYITKALQVVNEDSRQRIVSRRVLIPKGGAEGGGGGSDPGPGTLRKDFRVLAFWIGSLVTDKNGRASQEITLPESMTTYRIMAVASDKQSRFGWDQNEIRVNKPVLLTPAFPRFLAPGDKALFGGVVHSQLKTPGNATVTIKSLDPAVLAFSSEQQSVTVAGGGATEVRFNAVAKAAGTARVQMRVSMGRETDAFEDVIPVRVLASAETVAAYGDTQTEGRETVEIPADVIPGFGGLHMELASTAMVGLSQGAEYLVTYPYGCAEQQASKTLALVLVSELGAAFDLPGIDSARGKQFARDGIRSLEQFQCGNGGFSFWPGQCAMTSPYMTAYVLHVLHRARSLGYTVNQDSLNRAYTYMEQKLAETRPTNEAYMPSYTAWQAFSVKTLAEGGRNVDSHITRLHGYADRMPVFALAFLSDALLAKKEKGPRADDLRRRLTNAILPEGGSAYVNELDDPYLEYFWSSDVRSTAIVLGTLVRSGGDEQLVKNMVRWLMQARKGERWDDTQENAWALSSLIDYYRKYESEVPDFTGIATFGSESLAREAFKGRTTDAKSRDLSMAQLLAKAPAGQQVPVVFTREGTGTLFYLMRLRYARNIAQLQELSSGFQVTRMYRVQGGKADATTFKAGDLINVTLRIRNTKVRRFVAITDPLPAGTEAVDTAFATTASALVEQQQQANESEYDWAWWRRSGWDHIERHDDRVNVFATRLGEGTHEFKYLVRATTAGTFITAPAHAEEMYEPEVFGRTATVTVEVTP